MLRGKQRSPAAREGKWHPHGSSYKLLQKKQGEKQGCSLMAVRWLRCLSSPVQRRSMWCGFLQITRLISAARTQIDMKTLCVLLSLIKDLIWTNRCFVKQWRHTEFKSLLWWNPYKVKLESNIQLCCLTMRPSCSLYDVMNYLCRKCVSSNKHTQ